MRNQARYSDLARAFNGITNARSGVATTLDHGTTVEENTELSAVYLALSDCRARIERLIDNHPSQKRVRAS